VPRVGVPWNSEGFGETNGERGSRRRDRGNSVNTALDMIHAAKSRDGLQPQGEGEGERDRGPETQDAIANPESAHRLKVIGSSKQKGPPNVVVLSTLTKES
jgi:hypothetical protein